MRWITGGALLLSVPLMVLSVAGCGESVIDGSGLTGSAEPVGSASSVALAVATPAGAADGTAGGTAGFVTVVRAKLPEVAADRSDDEIAAVATTACTGLRDGPDAQTVVNVARSLDTLDAEAADEATARESGFRLEHVYDSSRRGSPL